MVRDRVRDRVKVYIKIWMLEIVNSKDDIPFQDCEHHAVEPFKRRKSEKEKKRRGMERKVWRRLSAYE